MTNVLSIGRGVAGPVVPHDHLHPHGDDGRPEQAKDHLLPAPRGKYEGAGGRKGVTTGGDVPLSLPLETPTAVHRTMWEALETPSEAMETPSAVKRMASAVKQTPSAVKQTPSAVKQTPSAVKQTPSAVKQTPSDSLQTTLEALQTPSADRIRSEADAVRFTADGRCSASD